MENHECWWGVTGRQWLFVTLREGVNNEIKFKALEFAESSVLPNSLFLFLCSLPSLHSDPSSHRGHWGEENRLQLRQPRVQETKLKHLTPPPVYGHFCAVALRCLTPTQLHSSPTVESVGRLGRRPICEKRIETRVRMINGTRVKGSMKDLAFQALWCNTQHKERRCSTVFPCIFLNPASLIQAPLNPCNSWG